MAIEITAAYPRTHNLKPGEVFMCRRRIKPKQHGEKPFDWRFFGLVLRAHRSAFVYIILDERAESRGPLMISYNELHDPEMFQLWFVPESQWPDGVHAFRTKLILEGRIEGVDQLM